MKKIIKSIIIIVNCSLMISCIQEQVTLADLNINTTSFNKTIAIHGVISSELEKQRVLLTIPSDWDDQETIYVNDAIVSLSNSTETYLYERAEREGVYESIDSISGSVGNTYTIEVIYNSQIYTASDSMVAALPVTEREKGILDYDESRRNKLFIQRDNFGYEIPSLWGFFSPIRSSWKESKLITAYYLSSPELSSTFSHIGTPPQGVFATPSLFNFYAEITETDSVEYIKCSISQQHYKYIIEVLNITHWDGGLFTTVPGNPKSNVSNGGYGYFFASDVRRERFMFGDIINN